MFRFVHSLVLPAQHSGPLLQQDREVIRDNVPPLLHEVTDESCNKRLEELKRQDPPLTAASLRAAHLALRKAQQWFRRLPRRSVIRQRPSEGSLVTRERTQRLPTGLHLQDLQSTAGTGRGL
jgi:hypothetical protein